MNMHTNSQLPVSEELSDLGLHASKNYPSSRAVPVFLIALTLVIGVVGGYFLSTFTASQEQSQQMVVLPNMTPLATPVVSPQNREAEKEDEQRLLLEKDIDGGKIRAFRLSDYLSEDSNSGVFALELDAGEFRPHIFSVSSPIYAEDRLFEIVGNEVWVVNGQTNKIDRYRYQVEKKEGNVTEALSHFFYLESIDLPRFNVGIVGAIQCTDEDCKVLTGFHQEAGCEMDLNILSKEYSNITCGGMGGEFDPDPIELFP